MKVTKEQLRRIIREAVKGKLEETSEASMIISKQSLQQLIDEEFDKMCGTGQAQLNEDNTDVTRPVEYVLHDAIEQLIGELGQNEALEIINKTIDSIIGDGHGV